MTNSFTIKAPGGTDIWRKPPATDVFNAPRAPPPDSTQAGGGTTPAAPLSSFRSARLSFLLQPTEQYDQAGLVLSLYLRGATHPFSAKSPPKWIKTGVEFYNGVPKAATVACDAWADWSLAPVSVSTSSSSAADGGEGGEKGQWVTVLVENSEDKLGQSLWVYQVVGAGEKVPLREVCWPFGSSVAGEEWDVGVEAYACRPAEEKGDLTVEFKDFEVKWA